MKKRAALVGCLVAVFVHRQMLNWPSHSYFSGALAVQFTEVASQVGITFKHQDGRSKEKYEVETFGSGVAWLDYDNDGFLDLYFANGANLFGGQRSLGNVLYRNTGQGRFVDVTREAGVAGNGNYATGVAVGDYDNDGFLDLYVTSYGASLLYRNNGNGAFTDVTEKVGVKGGRWGSSAGFFDYDRDGDLDLYVVNYLDYDLNDNPWCGPKKEGYRSYCDVRMFDGLADLLYRNNGDGTFTDVSAKAGIANPVGKGLGISVADFDQDGYVDIYIANDTVRNFLYRNRGDGTFEDITYSAGVGFGPDGQAQAGMGTDSGDYDGDGLPDIFVTNFSEELNMLYHNLGKLLFEDVTEKVGLGSGFLPLGFGTNLFDFDNDGDIDIFVTNGHVVDNVQLTHPHLSYEQTDLLYENVGVRFEDISPLAGPAFKIKHVGRGSAVGDFDNDGDLDIVVSNCGGRPMLLRNDGGNRNHWIAVKARGKSNRFGLGARVRVETSNNTQVKMVNNVASYLSSSELRLYFGLGKDTQAKSIEVNWPSGARQLLKDVPADQTLVLEEP